MRTRHPMVTAITRIAGRRQITSVGDQALATFARGEGGAETTADDGTPYFIPGVHGTIDRTWVVHP